MANRLLRQFGQTILVIILLAGGAVAAMLLIRSQPQAATQPRADADPLVEVQDVQPRDIAVQVHGYGTVRPGISVNIVPQVQGTILKVHPSMRAGGFFGASDVLIRIDPTDYELAIEEAKAELEQAEAERVRALASVADFEARLDDAKIEVTRLRELRAGNTTTQRELERAEFVLRQAKAQLRAAKAQTARARGAEGSAHARLKIAQVQLARTEISVPFTGRVMSEQVDVGQFVVSGQKLASVYSTQAMEIMVPLEDWQLEWFDAPAPGDGPATADSASPVDVTADFAGRLRTWNGRVARIEGQIDPTSRMVNVVVEAVEPFSQDSDRIILMPGMFVEVHLKGRTAHDVVPIPRRALRLNQIVWVVQSGRLNFREVEVVRHDRDVVYVRGLEAGQQLATSALDVVVDGMQVRTTLSQSDPDATHDQASRPAHTEQVDARRSDAAEPTAVP